jgi:hypothetical protein
MPKLDISYYAGDWSPEERAGVRAVLESAGFQVTEGDGSQKGWALQVPPQLLVDAVEAAKDIGALAGLITRLLGLYDRMRRRKPDGSIQVTMETRIYIVPLGQGEAGREAIRAIPADLKKVDSDRKGDLTWRDGRWLDVEELQDHRRVNSGLGRRSRRARRR